MNNTLAIATLTKMARDAKNAAAAMADTVSRADVGAVSSAYVAAIEQLQAAAFSLNLANAELCAAEWPDNYAPRSTAADAIYATAVALGETMPYGIPLVRADFEASHLANHAYY